MYALIESASGRLHNVPMPAPDLRKFAKTIRDPKILIAAGSVAGVMLACVCCGLVSSFLPSKPERGIVLTNGPESGNGLITFGNEVWKSTGETTFGGALIPGEIYLPLRGADGPTDERLLVLERAREDSGTIRKQLITQKRVGDRWIWNGLYQDWTEEGETMIATYVNGETEGECTHYFPNGKVLIREHRKAGKSHGLAERWWPNGQKQYEIEYNLGQEIWGKTWDENGVRTDRPAQ